MMKTYDQSVEINHNPNRPFIPDHLYRILIIGGSGSGKTNGLLNLIKNQRPDIDKIYLYKKINDQKLIKFIYTSKIHLTQSTNYLLMEKKK